MTLHYTYLLFLLALLTSCSKNLPLPAVETKNEIVILGELVAGEAPYIRAGQTMGIGSNGNQNLQLVKDITIKLQLQGNEIQLTGTEDSLSASLHTIPYTGNTVIQPEHIYTLTAQQTSLGTATANVIIPRPFGARILSITPTRYANEEVIKFAIQIDDPAGEDLYAIECVKQQIEVKGSFLFKGKWLDIPTNIILYDSLKKNTESLDIRYDTVFYNVFNRQFLYTNDINTDNLQENTTTSAYRRALLKDISFDGSAYTTEVYVRKNDIASSIINGRYVLMIKSVSKDYYQYLSQYEGIAGYSYSSSDIPATLKGNIKNGVGIVGGVYKKEFAYVADNIYPY